MILCLAVMLVYIRIVTMFVFTDKYKEDIFKTVNLNKQKGGERRFRRECCSQTQSKDLIKNINQKSMFLTDFKEAQ